MILIVRLATLAIFAFGIFTVTGSASAQSWTKQAGMKVARVEATTVDYRDNIYVFNGFKPGIKIANSVEKYDAATKKWSIITSTSTLNGSAVTHNGVVRTGADVWIIGGRIGNHPGRVSNKVWVFNLDNRKWRRGLDLPKPVAAGGAALVNNKVHWFGGLDSNARCDVRNHFVYDLDKPSAGWVDITAQAGMPSPRNHFSTAVVNGIIYAMGGQYGHDGCPGKYTQDTPLVHAFNPKTNKWSRKANMPNKNSHSEPGTFVYKGDIYTTGGENAKNKVWKYNPRSNKWSTYKTLAEELVAPIARIIDGRLIVAGGGAPIAQKSTDRVRSLLVDNNPPNPVPTPQPEPGSNTPERATLISMEAEYFDTSTETTTHRWAHVALGNSSNDDALISTPDHGELAGTTDNTPMLGYMVYFNSSGKHYIWVRGLGDTNASGIGSNDSIHVGLNGVLATSAYRIDRFPGQWSWSRHTPVNPVASLNVVNAGVNMINFWMREDGLAFDKFVITSDADFVPTDYGPDVTDGTDNYEPPANYQPPPSDDDTGESTDVSEDSNQINPGAPVEPDTKDDSGNSVEDEGENGSPTLPTVIDTDNAESDPLQPTGISVDTRGGLFGGSTSMATLLALVSVVLMRLGNAIRRLQRCYLVASRQARNTAPRTITAAPTAPIISGASPNTA